VGVIDCLRHHDNGLLVPPGDVNALTTALAGILDDEALRQRFADTALQEVRTTYAWPLIGRQIDGIYRQLVGTLPDVAWAEDLTTPEACRYRQAPHLL
jgi:glycosyltransferase involved in cell wall biosynthesis